MFCLLCGCSRDMYTCTTFSALLQVNAQAAAAGGSGSASASGAAAGSSETTAGCEEVCLCAVPCSVARASGSCTLTHWQLMVVCLTLFVLSCQRPGSVPTLATSPEDKVCLQLCTLRHWHVCLYAGIVLSTPPAACCCLLLLHRKLDPTACGPCTLQLAVRTSVTRCPAAPVTLAATRSRR